MKSSFAGAVIRLLIALMIWTPYQIAQAGMIGTEQIVQQSSAGDRNTVLNFVNRADVTGQLQALGIDPSNAKQRVAAMNDEEVRYLAGQVQALPAGGTDAWVWVVVILLIAAVVWWAWKR
jgi:hypothetical protein